LWQDIVALVHPPHKSRRLPGLIGKIPQYWRATEISCCCAHTLYQASRIRDPSCIDAVPVHNRDSRLLLESQQSRMTRLLFRPVNLTDVLIVRTGLTVKALQDGRRLRYCLDMSGGFLHLSPHLRFCPLTSCRPFPHILRPALHPLLGLVNTYGVTPALFRRRSWPSAHRVSRPVTGRTRWNPTGCVPSPEARSAAAESR